MEADVLVLPEESVATALTLCWPVGSVPVSQVIVPEQLVLLQGMVPNRVPSP